MSDLWTARPAAPTHLRVVEDFTCGQPIDQELERTLIGAVLISEQVLPALAIDEAVTPATFWTPWYGQVWQAMLTLHQNGEPVELGSVSRALLDSGATEERVAELDGLAGIVPSLGSVRFYARRLVKLAEWRAVKIAGIELAAAADTLDDDRRERAENLLAKREGGTSSTLTPEALGDLLFDHFASDEPTIGLPVPAPFHGLERSWGSLRPGETTLLGGWSSRGKSVCADQLLIGLAKHGCRVHLYINEMTAKVRGLRILAAESGVPLQRLMARITMSADERKRVMAALNRGRPFGITEIAGWGAPQIARDLRYRRWDVAVVDILHLIEYENESDLRMISQQLTTAARLTGMHLIMTVHLNEGRATQATLPPPVLRDIRGSGMLKNDADNVLFVHRDDEVDDRGVATVGDDATVYLAKCRNGALGAVALKFDGQHVRFIDQERFAA